MPKTWWLLLLFLAPVHAQEPPKPKAERPSPILLWEAKHATGTAYLFGTIHVPDPRVLKLPRVVQEAFDRSDVVLTEINMDGPTQAKALKMTMLPKGERLSGILPPELQQRIAKQIPMAALDAMKPWAAGMNLMMLHARKFFMSGRQALDIALPIQARAAGKQVGQLETVEEQIGIFDTMTIEEQIRMLEKTIKLIEDDKAAEKNSIRDLIDLYLAGDLDAILEFVAAMGDEPTEADEKFRKLLLDDRNVHMADRLAAKMKKAPGQVWFVAVGAAHYAGRVGVGKLLARKGFKVRRMTRSDTVKAPPREPIGAK